jgi:hypothetical protein
VRRVTEKMLLAGGKSSGSIWRGLLTFQGLWIGRPFVHQPAKDRCGTHRDHGKRKYNNQREPISRVKYQWNGCVRGISKASMSGLPWLLSRQTALAPSISALFIIPLVGENKAPGSEFPGALFYQQKRSLNVMDDAVFHQRPHKKSRFLFHNFRVRSQSRGSLPEAPRRATPWAVAMRKVGLVNEPPT